MTTNKSYLMILLAFFSLNSCKKQAPEKISHPPKIEVREVGTANSKLVYAGHDLHLDAQLTAPDQIANVKLQITYAKTDIAWDFLKTYTTGYKGLKNATFHEHIDIPETAKTGVYELLLIVTDQMGQSSREKTTFTIARDTSLPSAGGIAIKLNGNQLNVAADIRAQNKLQKIAVEVQSSPWTKVFEFTSEDMVGQTSYNFNRTMEISPLLGDHYHVNIFITDQLGKSITYAYHFDR